MFSPEYIYKSVSRNTICSYEVNNHVENNDEN